MTLFVPTEDSIFGYTTLEQSVVLDLKELEVKNPNMGTIDELMKRIMEGPPGQDLDRSLIEGEDPLAMKLTGGHVFVEHAKQHGGAGVLGQGLARGRRKGTRC